MFAADMAQYFPVKANLLDLNAPVFFEIERLILSRGEF